MPRYDVTDPRSGRSVVLEGDAPPNEQELDEIFAKLPPPAPMSAKSFIEPALTMATSSIAQPVAGLIGLGDLLVNGGESASDTVRQIQSGLTYEPNSEEGRRALEHLSTFLAPIGTIMGKVEGGAGDAGYAAAKAVGADEAAPAVGAIARGVPAALMEALGLRGLRSVRGATRMAGISDDVAAMAERNGISIDDPANIERLQALTAQQAADQARRAGIFEKLDIPTTRSRITQNQGDFLSERTLARQVGTKEGQAVQDRLIEEALGFRNAADKIGRDLGIHADAGDTIKEALEARLTGLRDSRQAAYQELARLSEGKGMPLAGDSVLETLRDPNIAGMAGRLEPAARQKLNDLMVEYGLDTNPERAADWVSRRKQVGEGGAIPTKAEITPLSVLNAEDFRQALNGMIDPSGPKELNGVAAALKRGLDDELGSVDASLAAAEKGGDLGDLGRNTRDVLAAAKRARDLASQMKSEYSPKSLAGMLTSTQKGTFDRDLIASSEVTKKILSSTQAGTIENVSELMDSLSKAGRAGQKAIGNLQAATVLDLMENATAARSGKLAEGVIDWNGTNFARRFDEIGSKKLRRIFQTNPQALDMLENLRDAGNLKTSLAAVAKSSGTADDLVNFFQNAGLLAKVSSLGSGLFGTLAGKGFEVAGTRLQARAARKAAQRQLSAQPDTGQVVQQVKRLYPNMAVALGIGGLSGDAGNSK